MILLMTLLTRGYFKYHEWMSNRVVLLLVFLSIIPVFNTAWLLVTIYTTIKEYITYGKISKEDKELRIKDALEQLETAIDLIILRFKK